MRPELTTKIAMNFVNLCKAEKWYDEACRRNHEEQNPNVCHTHDFCDANMVMHAAFRMEGIADAENETHVDTWNAAWKIAAGVMEAGLA